MLNKYNIKVKQRHDLTLYLFKIIDHYKSARTLFLYYIQTINKYKFIDHYCSLSRRRIII